MAEIKKIQLPGITTPYDLCDEYARKRIEGLSTVYTISCENTAGGTYVDWDTEQSVTVTAANVKNGSFKSTADQISITGSGADGFYLVLESKSSGVNYAKQMTKMAIGDTIYVKENIDVAADRWLSSVDVASGSITAKFDALSGKIDLSEYALKTEAGKAGTYTTAEGGAGSTGNAGAQTAAGTATVTYEKAATATGSAGAATITTTSAGAGEEANTGDAGGATINGSNFTFTGTAATINVSTDAVTLDDHSYTPAGSLSGTQSIGAHSHGVNIAKSTITNNVTGTATGEVEGHTHSVTVSGDITLGDLAVSSTEGTVTYTPAGDVTATYTAASTTSVVKSVTAALAATPEFTGTFDTISISGSVTGASVASHTYTPEGTISAVTADAHNHTVTTHEHNTAVTAISGYPNFSGGSASGTFNTDAINDVTLSASTVSTDGPKYLEDAEYTDTAFNTANVVTGYGSFNGGTFTQGAKASLTYVAATSASALNGATVNSSGVLSWTTASFNTDASKVTGWSENGTDTFTPASLGNASTVTVLKDVKTAGAISKTIKYIKRTLTNATTASVAFTPANLGAASTVSAAGTTKSKTITSSDAGAINVTPTFTGTIATLTHSVTQGTFSGSTSYTPAGTVTKPSITVTPTTVSVNTDAIKAITATFTGTGVRLVAAAGSVTGSMTGTAASAGAHTHSLTNSSLEYVSSATIAAGGSATVDFSKATFTGTAATLEHSFTDATVSAGMSGTYTPEGTIGGSQTIADHSHSYTKAAAHTHDVTIENHTHSIELIDTTITGTVSVAVSSHTHSIGNHTHSVTISAIKAS